MPNLEPAHEAPQLPVIILIDELAHYRQAASERIGPLLDQILRAGRSPGPFAMPDLGGHLGGEAA